MTWRNMPREEIELEFNPRATARNVDERVARYAAKSEATRTRLECALDVRYGPGEVESPLARAMLRMMGLQSNGPGGA